MINSIRLTRFKQFKDTEIELRPFSILMGQNNSGKTTVLQAIWLALSSLHQGKLLTIDKKTLQIKVSSTGYYMFDFPFVPKDDLNSLFYNKISREGSTYDETSGTILEVTDERGNSFKLHLRELFKNLNVKLLTPAQDIVRPEIQKFAPLYISGFSGLPFQEERMFPATIETRIASGDVQSIVRNIVLDLRQHAPEKYRYLEKIMKEEFDFRIREVHYYGDNELFVFSEYEESKKEGNIGLEFSSCGSGILQILQIIAVILRSCPEKTQVVLIDEPDAHLHEGLQIRLADILRKLQQKLGIQIILSTHSAAMIRCAEPEEVIPVLSGASYNKGVAYREDIQDVIESRLDTYDLGRAKIAGKFVFFEHAGVEILERMADILHLDLFSGVNTIPVIRDWKKEDHFPFALNSILGEVLGRAIEMHVVCNKDDLTEETEKKLAELAETNDVKLHTISKAALEACAYKDSEGKSRRSMLRMLAAEDICTEAKELLEALTADTEAFEVPVMKAKKTAVKKNEFEQLTLLDL